MFDRIEVLQNISDLSKEVYGFRMRLNYSAMADAELEETWNNYIDMLEEVTAREKDVQAKMFQKWTSHINDLMVSNNIDKATALRWDLQAMDCDVMSACIATCGISAGLTRMKSSKL